MQPIFAVIEKVADTPSTVLITGESGTGKELVAKALHEQSSRKSEPFIKINCAAIPKTLMESELFGYEKGAFTGATSSKPGRFELADGGTLFLDEIGEIPVEMQVKLLRALQESEFERVGGIKTIKVDVRLITATNRDLEQEIAARQLPRGSLLPAQRRAAADPAAARAHRRHPAARRALHQEVQRAAEEDDHRASPTTRSPRSRRHTWPGNIRELENVLERTILFCKGERIERADLQLESGGQVEAPAVARTTSSGAMAPVLDDDDDDDDESVAAELAGAASGSLKDIVRAETCARRARADRQGARRDRRQRDPGRTPAQDQPQEPADEDEGARAARSARARRRGTVLLGVAHGHHAGNGRFVSLAERLDALGPRQSGVGGPERG